MVPVVPVRSAIHAVNGFGASVVVVVVVVVVVFTSMTGLGSSDSTVQSSLKPLQ